MDVMDAIESLKPSVAQKSVNVAIVQADLNQEESIQAAASFEDPGFHEFTTQNGNIFVAVVRNNFVYPLIVTKADMDAMMGAVGVDGI